MFERRLKVLLGIIASITLVLILRAGWLQVVQGSEWQKRALDTGRRSSYLETNRGEIRDFRGRTVAEDAPCIDAAVDYRAIDIEAKESQEWLKAQARQRLQQRGVLKGDREDRARLVEHELARMRDDLRVMWQTLAEVSNKSPDELEEIKQSIIRRVQMRRRYVWYKRYEEAKERHEQKEPASGWLAWLVDDSQAAPQLDSFKVTVAEQTESHVILRAVDNDTYIKLDRLRDRCPGLELKKSTHRHYPYADIACHVIGNLSPVMREDLENDPNVDKDETRKYFYNDLIGRSGVERLGERMLRGARGYVVRQIGREGVVETVAPAAGQHVQITLDMELQMRVQEAFLRYKETDDPLRQTPDLRARQMPVHEMHGAAVVIDVPTGQVRAMVSYPTYDLNQFESLYPKLVKDVINQPLMNRATQSALEPGSTVKPVVGIGGITSNVVRVDEGLECTGYLVINGKQLREGRCWVATKFAHILGNVAHHPIPSRAPHPTGFLIFADAIERSCNVYFETVADRLGMQGLAHWYREFGMGRLTEIGIAESRGRVPGEVAVPNWRSATWFSGIGQSQVLATPLQMANVAATIARRGVWIRPHLLVSETAQIQKKDLGLSAAAIQAAHDGMVKVVNSQAGTGTILHRDDMVVAAKTGTAQAATFNVIVRDGQGKPVRDANGRIVRKFFKPSTPDEPNPEMPWYRGGGNSGSELGHAWFIGFAPAENPKIAFAVLVEYGGSGGKDAGPIAQAILDACVEHGYLSPRQRK